MPAPVKTIADYFPWGTGGPESETDPSLRGAPNGRFALAYSVDLSGSNPDVKYVTGVAGGVGDSAIPESRPGSDETQLTQAITPSGFRLAVWTQKNDATNDQDIYARIFGPSAGGTGQLIANDFVVNLGLQAGNQFQPQAIALGEDGFLVVWVDGPTQRVRGMTVDVGGHLAYLGTVSQGAVTQDFELGAAQLANGNLVVTYRLDGFNAAFRWSLPGLQGGSEIDYDGVAGGTGATAVAALADGRFAIIARDVVGITGRIFNADGTPSVATFNVLAGGDYPKAIGLPDGRFFVINSGIGQLFGQMMNQDGTKDGGVVAINTVTAGVQSNADMALLADGRIAIAWQTSENGNNDIKMTVFDPRETGIDLVGTSLADNYVGSAFDDFIATGAGNDTVSAGSGDDIVSGGTGNDNLDGGSGNDILRGGAGDDVHDGGTDVDAMTGSGGNDRYFVDNAGDLVAENVNPSAGGTADRVFASVSYVLANGVGVEVLSTTSNVGTGSIDLTGNEQANALIGNAGTNVLDGGGGIDNMTGFGGNDWYFVDHGADIVAENASAAIGGTADRVFARTSYALAAGTGIEILSTASNSGTGAIDLTGNELAQSLIGNSGANVLNGKAGKDAINGLGGADIFVFDSALNTAPGSAWAALASGANVDNLSDFNVADDTIRLDNAVFAGLTAGVLAAGAFNTGTAASQADDRIIYDPATGALIFDPDGSAGSATVFQFAVVDPGLALTNADFFVI